MNFTEGKWELKGEDIVSDSFVSWIAKVNMDCYKFKHNADLIKAAPLMYEALKFLTENRANWMTVETRAKVNEAIAKADGIEK